MNNNFIFLETLERGDRIQIIYGSCLKNAVVLDNFPEKQKIYLRIAFGIFGIGDVKEIFDYTDYNFELL